MRIVGGRFRGKKLRAPEGPDTRPTSDRAREAVFNILAHGAAALNLDGVTVVDLFCGTGALGLEALSRGAGRCVFVDNNQATLRIARENAAACGVWRDCLQLALDAGHLPPPPRAAWGADGERARLALLDPPYGAGLAGPALLGLAAKGWLADGAIVVVEVGADEELAVPRGFEQLDERRYGAAKVYFLKKSE